MKFLKVASILFYIIAVLCLFLSVLSVVSIFAREKLAIPNWIYITGIITYLIGFLLFLSLAKLIPLVLDMHKELDEKNQQNQ